MENTEKQTPPPTEDLSHPESTKCDTEDVFENILQKVGGLGPFQFFIYTVSLGSKLSVAAVFLYMSFAGATPDFWCSFVSGGNESDVSVTLDDEWKARNVSKEQMLRICDVNGTSCSSVVFQDGMTTIVTEWGLVCNKKWVSSTITSVQMAGVLLGAFTAGQMADMWGRRKTCITLLAGQMVFSIANAFSPNWIFFIITRLGAGFCAGGYMVPYITMAVEFTDVRWRTYISAVPGWQMGVALMSLAGWQLHHWQYLGIYIAVLTLPFLFAWCFMPESVRWLLVHERVEEAQAVLCRAAKWNGTQAPDETVLRKLAASEMSKTKSQRVYTIRDLFRTRETIKVFCVLFFVWFSSGLVYYFLSFGAEKLSGNIFLNITLLTTVEIPAMILASFLNNKIGRRRTAFLLYFGAGLSSAIVVILIHTDTPGVAVNVLVLVAKLTMGGGWVGVTIFSVENFPTVIRNIGFGAVSMAARAGSIVAPQLVFMYDTLPSIPYVVVTVLMVGSSLCVLKIRETNDQALEDVLPSDPATVYKETTVPPPSVPVNETSASEPISNETEGTRL